MQFSFLPIAQHLHSRILEFHSRIAELVLECQREQDENLRSLVRAIKTNEAIQPIFQIAKDFVQTSWGAGLGSADESANYQIIGLILSYTRQSIRTNEELFIRPFCRRQQNGITFSIPQINFLDEMIMANSQFKKDKRVSFSRIS